MPAPSSSAAPTTRCPGFPRRTPARRRRVLVRQSRAGGRAGGTDSWTSRASSSCRPTPRRSNSPPTEGYGADIVPYDRERDDREAIGRRLAEERGLALIPPYDHPDVIAGQGTAARELFEDAGPLDVLLVPCGGGGLLAGSALAAAAMSPGCASSASSPRRETMRRDRFDRSNCRRCRIPRPSPTAPAPLARLADVSARAAARQRHDDGRRRRAAAAMFYLWERLKLIVEPTGALGAAAAFEGADPCGRPPRRRHPDRRERRLSQVSGWLAGR